MLIQVNLRENKYENKLDLYIYTHNSNWKYILKNTEV